MLEPNSTFPNTVKCTNLTHQMEYFIYVIFNTLGLFLKVANLKETRMWFSKLGNIFCSCTNIWKVQQRISFNRKPVKPVEVKKWTRNQCPILIILPSLECACCIHYCLTCIGVLFLSRSCPCLSSEDTNCLCNPPFGWKLFRLELIKMSQNLGFKCQWF